MKAQVIKKRLSRLRSVSRMGVMAFGLLLFSSVLTGYFLHQEIITTYSENYMLLREAGIVDIIQSPEVVSQRILILISVIPLMGACLVLPLLFKAACDIRMLSEDVSGDPVDEDV